MPDGIPVWVTTIVQPLAIIIVFGVIVCVLMWLVLKQVAERLAVGTIARFGQQVEHKKQEVLDMEKIHAEARAVLTSVTAFEMDSSLPLKLRQQAAGLRLAELKYAYEQAVAAIQHSHAQLRAERKMLDSEPSIYRASHQVSIRALNESIAEQEAAIAKMEPELERYGVAYEKLARPMRAV